MTAPRRLALVGALVLLGIATPTAARVDVNRASVAELERVPGLGPVSARAIVAHRARNGPFRTLSDLAAVEGIDPSIVPRLAPHLSVGIGRTASVRAPPRLADAPFSPPASSVSGRQDDGEDLDLTSRDGRVAAREGPVIVAGGPDRFSSPSGVRLPAVRSDRASDRVNVNLADAEELSTLPGIGASKARAIVAHRARRGPFRASRQLTRVSGIGRKTLEQLEGRITLRADLNSLAAEELVALGLGPVAARKVVAYRDANGPFRRVRDLARVPGVGRGALATLKGLVWVEEP